MDANLRLWVKWMKMDYGGKEIIKEFRIVKDVELVIKAKRSDGFHKLI